MSILNEAVTIETGRQFYDYPKRDTVAGIAMGTEYSEDIRIPDTLIQFRTEVRLFISYTCLKDHLKLREEEAKEQLLRYIHKDILEDLGKLSWLIQKGDRDASAACINSIIETLGVG